MRKTNRSLASIAARIRASKDSPAGSEVRSRKTLCPSPLSDSSMRVANSACSDEYDRKMVRFTAVFPEGQPAGTLQEHAARSQEPRGAFSKKRAGRPPGHSPPPGGNLDLGCEGAHALQESARADAAEITGQPRTRFPRP